MIHAAQSATEQLNNNKVLCVKDPLVLICYNVSMTGQLIFSYENVPMLYISIFEKAFVPVSHSKLLIKLKDYGLTGKL